ncbi:acyltransferase [Ruoffia sp. FAM 26254]|uniref:acyltransferase n=1 Tax=Ruoffia sp. FAM 26254 TaxID=3259518 RepID=UPI0038853295
MKNLFKKIYIGLSRIIMSLFYDKSYFRGKHFKNSTKGWQWCWRNVFMQKIIGINKSVPFPVSFRSDFGHWYNIEFDLDDLNNFQHFGCYYQSWNGKIIIGKGTYIAPNVGLITENHDLNNLDKHTLAKDIKIGNKCWIGMNSMLLPGVELGSNTIVGAGSVVTKSFEAGNCVIAGSPAKIIKFLD